MTVGPLEILIRRAEIEEETVNIRRYIAIFLSYWWIMVLLPLVGAASGYLYSGNQTKVYEAGATLLVHQRTAGLVPGVSDVGLSQQLAATYGRQLTASPFISKVLETHDLPRLGSVSTKVGRNPPALEVMVRDRDPALAANSAEIIALEFIDHVVELRLSEIARLQAAAAAQGILASLAPTQLVLIDSLSLLEPVRVPSVPILPRTRTNVITGVLLGGVLSASLVLLLGTRGDTVRDPGELRRLFGLTPLGTVFKWSDKDAGRQDLVLQTNASSGYSESFRQIRANFQFAMASDPGKKYLITSPGPGDGKSTVLANLAVAMGQSGSRVLLIDGDLRRPSLHRMFKLVQREPGLSNVLADQNVDLPSVIQITEVEGISIVAGGITPPNPSELLGSPRMAILIEQLKQTADIVLIDSPPVLMFSDASILASQVDAAILVVDGLNTRTSALATTLSSLSQTRVNVMGVIINKITRPRFGYGYGYQYYDYSDYYNEYSGDSHKAQTNGVSSLYRSPVGWVKSVFSRRRGFKD